jgi:hypothetical protein
MLTYSDYSLFYLLVEKLAKEIKFKQKIKKQVKTKEYTLYRYVPTTFRSLRVPIRSSASMCLVEIEMLKSLYNVLYQIS